MTGPVGAGEQGGGDGPAGPRGLGLDDPRRENAVLLDIVEATASGPGVEPLAAAVARVITEATATDVCFVHVLDDTERALTLVGATPPYDAEVGAVRLPLGHGVTGWVAGHREPVVIARDKHADPRYVPIPGLHGERYTSMVSVPMLSEPAGLVGVLNVHTVAPREFGEHDVRFLLAIGRLLAGAVHQARLHRRLAARERAHERFVEQTVAAQEAERRRLAREIHDGISQRLVTLSYHLDAAVTLLDQDAPADARAEVARGCELVDMTLEEARAAIGALRPPVLDDLGLPGALAALARELPGVATTLRVDDRRLPEHLEVALYRIAQEALQNVQKHSGAERVTVGLEIGSDHVRLAVTDDGVGFEPGDPTDPRAPGTSGRPYDGYGLASVRERAELVGGTVRLTSRPGSGTTLAVRAPLPTDPES